MDFVSRSFSFRPGDPCVVIGEIGVNHNNDPDLLFKLIDAGIEAGVDIVKLQRFKASEEIAVGAPTTNYQKAAGSGQSQLEMAQALELPDELLVKAFEYCKTRKVGFLCTAFDHSSVDFVADVLGCKSVKVPSPEITNRPLLERMFRKFPGLLISTGASYFSEIAQVMEWASLRKVPEVALMHCVSEYPAPVEEVNLRAIDSMRAAFNVPVGFSDHTEGYIVPLVAASRGAAMIEKHFTLDKTLPGPDHAASADIPELREFIRLVRVAHSSLGDGIKRPAASENDNRPLIRKSLTCGVEHIEAGSVIEESMLSIKRPQISGAVEPFDLEKIVGLRIRCEKRFDQPILWSDFGD